MWVEAQIQKRVPLSLLTVETETRKEGVQACAVSSGWF
jgi:hypothetical protein